MIKSEIRSITIVKDLNILKIELRCCLMLVVSYAPETIPEEKRQYFECDDFWMMIDKLCKKHKLGEYAPSPSLEEDLHLFDILEHFFKVTYA